MINDHSNIAPKCLLNICELCFIIAIILLLNVSLLYMQKISKMIAIIMIANFYWLQPEP